MKITDKKATEFYKCFINLNQIAKNLSSIATKDYTINNGILYTMKDHLDLNPAHQKLVIKNISKNKPLIENLPNINGLFNGKEIFEYHKNNKKIDYVVLNEYSLSFFGPDGNFKSKSLFNEQCNDYTEFCKYHEKFSDNLKDIRKHPIFENLNDPFIVRDIDENDFPVSIRITKDKSIKITKRLVGGLYGGLSKVDTDMRMYYNKVELKRNSFYIALLTVDTPLFLTENYFGFILD